MNYPDVEREYRRLKGEFASGSLTKDDLKSRLEKLMIQDEEGHWWMIGYESGQWFTHDGENWVQSIPYRAPPPPPVPGPVPLKPPGPHSTRSRTVALVLIVGSVLFWAITGFIIWSFALVSEETVTMAILGAISGSIYALSITWWRNLGRISWSDAKSPLAIGAGAGALGWAIAEGAVGGLGPFVASIISGAIAARYVIKY